MVNPKTLYDKIIAMPPEVAEEVNDFVDFVISRKKNEQENTVEPAPGNGNQLPTSGFGCMKGMFKMAPDFDEPLEDFKDYM